MTSISGLQRAAPKEPRVCFRCWQPYQALCGNQKYCQSCQVSACRERRRLYSRIYYRANRERCIEITRRAQERNRERYLRLRREYESAKIKRVIPLVLGHYSNQSFTCACCGEKEQDFLTIDHINGSGNKISKSLGIPRGGSGLYRWLVRNHFPPGYAVLCANCNSSKGKRGSCVHKRKQGLRHSVQGWGHLYVTGWRPPKGGSSECKRCGMLFQRKCGNQRYCEICRQPRRREYNRRYGGLYCARNVEKMKARLRQWRIENPEQDRRLKLIHSIKKARMIRMQVLSHYSDGASVCMCCGQSELDFLGVDRIDGNANQMSKEKGVPRSGSRLYA